MCIWMTSIILGLQMFENIPTASDCSDKFWKSSTPNNITN
jgi:hypothetical protein